MQINRLFEIIYILLENKTVTAKQLAERFEVSERTIYRDVETLSEAGIPVYMSKGKGGGISLLPDFILNKAVLTGEEKSEILSSMKVFSAVNLSEKTTALTKLDSMLGKSESDWIQVDFTSWSDDGKEAETFALLKDAVLKKKAVVFDYTAIMAEKSERKIYPLKMLYKSQAWYLFGYCLMRNDCRCFKLRRIKNLKVIDETFDMKAPAVISDNDKIYNKTLISAKFEISKRMAFRVYDEFKDFYIDDNGDFICSAEFPDMITICSYAMSYGEFCKIIEPEEAKECLIKKIADIQKIYL